MIKLITAYLKNDFKKTLEGWKIKNLKKELLESYQIIELFKDFFFLILFLLKIIFGIIGIAVMIYLLYSYPIIWQISLGIFLAWVIIKTFSEI